MTSFSLPAPDISSDPAKPIIEARLDLSGVEIAPNEIISQVFPLTTPVEFHWQVRPPVSGRYPGAIWLHEIGLAENGQGTPEQRLVAIQAIEIRAVGFLGLNAYIAQILAILGIILGIGLSLDMFYEWVYGVHEKTERAKMTLVIQSFIQGPVDTNAYLIGDEQTKQAVVIDPAWDGRAIAADAIRRGWHLNAIWLTHAHFDHIAGAAAIAKEIVPQPALALHPEDLPLYQIKGGAILFGLEIEAGPKPTITLVHGQELQVGTVQFQVRHTPGHTPGHVVFYSAAEKVVFCGDVIFRASIGRTDLPGGDYQTLMNSIETQILSLPDETILFSGHGPDTRVGIERLTNPYII